MLDINVRFIMPLRSLAGVGEERETYDSKGASAIMMRDPRRSVFKLRGARWTGGDGAGWCMSRGRRSRPSELCHEARAIRNFRSNQTWLIGALAMLGRIGQLAVLADVNCVLPVLDDFRIAYEIKLFYSQVKGFWCRLRGLFLDAAKSDDSFPVLQSRARAWKVDSPTSCVASSVSFVHGQTAGVCGGCCVVGFRPAAL